MKSTVVQLQKVREKIELERLELEDDYLVFENRFLKFLNPVNNYLGIGSVEDSIVFYGFITLVPLVLLITHISVLNI